MQECINICSMSICLSECMCDKCESEHVDTCLWSEHFCSLSLCELPWLFPTSPKHTQLWSASLQKSLHSAQFVDPNLTISKYFLLFKNDFKSIFGFRFGHPSTPKTLWWHRAQASLDAFDVCADRALKGTLFPLPHQELPGTRRCPASRLPSLWEGASASTAEPF